MSSGDRERMLAGEPYDPWVGELRGERASCRKVCERFNRTPFAAQAERLTILRTLFGSIGEGAEVLAPFQCDYGSQIHLGARSFINFGAVVLDEAEVRIGADVQIGPSVQLITALHPLNTEDRRRGTETARPITIGDGAWLAAGVIVCPGVTIGQDTVVGAGSVVTRDLPDGMLCFGNPCRPIRPARDR